jgi:hypothetical protein
MIVQSILIIMIGAPTAIAFWELEKYAKRKKKEAEKEKLEREINDTGNNIARMRGRNGLAYSPYCFQQFIIIISI